MSERTVTTQVELDRAIADKVDDVYIESPSGVWLEVTAYDSSTVTAYGSSTVRATGSSTVTAYDSSTVTATGSSTVTAYGSSTVTATGSSTVTATGSSTVTATGSSTVTAYDSSTVTAYDSSTVTAYDSSTVTATGSSTVTATGSSTVTATGSSTVTATKYTAVHLHSKRVTLDAKGAVIDVTRIDKHNPESWCDYTGTDIAHGTAVVYKAVDADLKSGRGLAYPIGETVADPRWAPTDACGAGLHFGPTPGHALAYNPAATRFLACRIDLSEAVGISGGDTPKIKARSCVVLHEVDVAGRKIGVTR